MMQIKKGKFVIGLVGVLFLSAVVFHFGFATGLQNDLGAAVFSQKYAIEQFEDVPSSAWYASAVENLSSRGIITGDGGKFYPQKYATKAETAVMVNNMLVYLEDQLDGDKVVVAERKNKHTSVDLGGGFDPLSDLEDAALPSLASLNVGFSSQAPLEDWGMPYQEACEEISMMMVDSFLDGKTLNKLEANKGILDLVKWQEDRGYAVDISAQQVVDILKAYFGRNARLYVGDDVSVMNIKKLVNAGYPVLLPVAGQQLGNIYYTGGGPLYHMIVVTGYQNGNFVVNDPGTKRGKDYQYQQTELYKAIHDWSGTKGAVLNGQKAMVVVE